MKIWMELELELYIDDDEMDAAGGGGANGGGVANIQMYLPVLREVGID